ncbi:transcription initiation factor TFIID subunit 4 isoform X1 [Bombyx mandarina]|uniref:TAFH domain-containing protein n=2 Tax=Bombyx TaxID=7090 RepID=A0A8R2DJS4_BOMMO|nr:transcription initiation factor TFIID subunit 4 isoform X1 [Bombyx mori]XP_028026915.1 transcription initiation factor TFIID subunit 4 isoform X1 [Bombyx mandarina]
MASTEFLEEALSTDVDEKAVNAIVGTLENQLVTNVSSAPSQNILVNVLSSQFPGLSSNAGSIISGHKYTTGGVSCGIAANSIHRPSLTNSTSCNNVQSSVPGTYSSLTPGGTVTNCNDNIQVIYSQAQAFSNPNSVTFPAQSLPNGFVGLSSSQNHLITSVDAMQPPLVLKQGTSSGQVGIQSGMVTVPMTANSSMSGSIPNVMTLNKPGQNVVVTTQNLGSSQPTILPNVQILNMRAGAPAVAAQKSVATVSPRVVIGTPQVVGTRAAGPGITLQTLPSLQPGQQGHLLLKTENGQYQLLRVGPAPAASSLTTPQPQTIRLSTVPAHPGVATVSTSMASSPIPGQMPAAPMATPVIPASIPNINCGTPPPQSQPPTVTTVKPSDNTKEKCRNFLANLLDLSSKEPPSVEMNVRNLIQELIDAQVEPEEFCNRLERLLNASPQPCLIGFLKKSLPLLRQSLVTKELVIEGINPPAPHIAFSTMPSPAQPVVATSNIQLPSEEDGSSPTLTPLLPPVMPLTLANLTKPINVQSLQTTAPTQQQKPPSKPGSTIAVLQNIPVHTKINVSKVSSGKSMQLNNKGAFPRGQLPSAALSTVLTPGKSLLKDKEKKSSSYSQPFTDDKMAGDDDINDVAAMGGVNLAEESQRILGSTEMIGTQIRSCKDEYLVPTSVMQARVKAIIARHNLDEPTGEVAALISHAVQERLKNLIEKLAVIAQHRIDHFIKSDSRYEVTQDVKGQLKFLEELDRVDKKRREDSEREMLLRAAKSRSKNEDPEQAKLKAKAKEMQRAELEELRQREANLTALQAIGPRKKPRLEAPGASGDTATPGPQTTGFPGRSQLALRTRLKRINHRDMLFLLEQERDTCRSLLLYKSYLK